MQQLQWSTLLLTWSISLGSAHAITFQVPGSSGNNAATLDLSPVSFGFPFATLTGYFDGMPLASKCLDTFRSVSGVWPRIRVGGTSEDYGTFDPTLKVPNIVTGTAPTGQSQTTYGPQLVQVLANYKGTIVWGLNRGFNNLTNTIEAAKVVVKTLPTLYALELGNEPDGIILQFMVFAALNATIANGVDWNFQTEAESESKWQAAVGQALGRDNIVQASSYYQTPARGWGAANYFKFADPTADRYIKVYSHHNYPQTAVGTSNGEDPPNVQALMSHVNITKNVGLYVDDVKAAATRGFDYVFGETNSVSGNGKPGQGDTFATGMWVLDYVLRAASIGIKRAYFHQGTPGKSYYVWFNATGIQSPIYGGYFAAEAFAGASKIAALDDGTTNQAGYVLFSKTGKAQKVILVNSDYYDGSGIRSSTNFILNGLTGGNVQAQRLTAKTSLSRQASGDAPSFSGQSFSDTTCNLVGKKVVESVAVKGGSANFTLAASEALLILL
ncbi:glycoside hydrolase family 79 protein [Aaosphaeria arxii CBS 175.79]|uniref:Glycoside hydrolase family 79 protein n=1 Tax=Aaosphaeria arxii CBS 175.79 TaxID=1450172 RepID=A0A6A5XMH4_9PLEO|nr:glycoside hydrolase family 79 protein [Aaosphaeria arxii CBS 175.79]KAF2014445.1 glycoside hydrolase family 79 protein [Aaosphaeria arxii CBS 175.79]